VLEILDVVLSSDFPGRLQSFNRMRKGWFPTWRLALSLYEHYAFIHLLASTWLSRISWWNIFHLSERGAFIVIGAYGFFLPGMLQSIQVGMVVILMSLSIFSFIPATPYLVVPDTTDVQH